jgi:hypothetical protein
LPEILHINPYPNNAFAKSLAGILSYLAKASVHVSNSKMFKPPSLYPTTNFPVSYFFKSRRFYIAACPIE